MWRGASRSESRTERVESARDVSAFGIHLFPGRRPGVLMPAGLAQAKHTGPLDSDAALEAQIRNLQTGDASSPGKARGLSVPARVWIAIGAAALLWAAVAGLIALIS